MDKIEMKHIRDAAVHESGHSLAARVFGAMAIPKIWRSEIATPGFTNIHGKATIFFIESPTEKETKIIHIAGLVAEAIANIDDPEKLDKETLFYYVEEFLETSVWSDEDFFGAGKNWKKHIAETIQIIMENFREIKMEADALVENFYLDEAESK